MIRLGLLGYPVGHSLSRPMHEAAARALGLELMYMPCQVAPEALPEALRGMVALGWDGVNLTVPHKESAFAMAQREGWSITPAAAAIGAVNTFARRSDAVLVGDSASGNQASSLSSASSGAFAAHNTDAEGLMRSLEAAGHRLEQTRALVLGAGGAARAAAFGLLGRGAAEVCVCARRVEQAAGLVSSMSQGLGQQVAGGPPLSGRLRACSWDPGDKERWASTFAEAELIVQATSATLVSDNKDASHAEAFAASIPWAAVPKHAVVVDLVYKPRMTTVLAQASAYGLHVVDGLGMLAHQGALAFALWTGREPPAGVMEQVLRATASA